MSTGGYSGYSSSVSTPQLPQTNVSYAYYVDGMRTGPSTCFETTYHSHNGCVLLKNEKEKSHTTLVHKITVAEMKKIRDFQGRVIKPCAACWTSSGTANVVVPGSLAETDPRYQAPQTTSAINPNTDPRYVYSGG